MPDFTKKAIIASFIKILKEKPFEKITIHEITADCGVARMTFYYHFQDIYDLLDYIIEEKLRASVSRAFTYETWQNDYLAVFHTILEEKDFFLKIFHSIDLRRTEHYLSAFAHRCIEEMVTEQKQRLGLTVNKKKQEMICDTYCYGMVGLLLKWMSNGMAEDPRALIDDFCSVIKGTLDIMLKNSAENN
jgi:probable dihydroxyacetone kinase regulator